MFRVCIIRIRCAIITEVSILQSFNPEVPVDNYRIFIVEDDSVIAQIVEKHLACWGYQVKRAQNFNEIMREFCAFDPQLVLMDITLPFFNGFHWCAEIRKLSKVPILFLSSASDNMNLIMAVNMGGDDFLSKPFDLPVLTAKVQALLRRAYDFGEPSHLIKCKDAVLDVSSGILSYRDQKTELTKNELRILRLLLENRGKIVSRDALMTALWESEEYVDENTLSVNINRLRRKIKDTGLPDMIRAVKGEG